MDEISIKTHLIITDIHEEYNIDWCGKLFGANPEMKNEKPIFILISSDSRIELNTWDMKEIERVGKLIAKPKGKEAVTEDKTRVYLKELNEKERLMCIITRRKIKTFAPMHDKVGWR